MSFDPMPLDGSGNVKVAVQNPTTSVSVTNFPATQTVNGTLGVSSIPSIPAGSNNIGSVNVANFPGTQNISGTVTIKADTALNQSNALKVDGSGVTQPVSGTVSVSNFPATQPVSGTFWQATQPVSGTVAVSNFPATQPVSGTFWQATQPVSGTVAISGTVPVSGTFWQATQPVSGTVAISGTPSVAQSGTWTVLSNPTTSGGLSAYKLNSAASTNAQNVKSSAGQVYNVQAFNTASSARYVKLYNKATAPTVGTDTPVATWMIPANTSGFVIEISNGLALSTGISIAITGAGTDADTTAIAANEVILNIQYK